MRLIASVLLLLLSATFVLAQTSSTDASTSAELIRELSELPKCATTCITRALPNSSCKLGDFDCLCDDKAYIESTGNCVLSSCSNKNALATQAWQSKVCKAPIRDKGPETSRVNIALVVLSTICVAGRFLARWRMSGSTIGWDDWTILAAWLMVIPSTTMFQIMIHLGLGRDIWTVPFDDITRIFKLFYISQYFYQAIIALTKMSIVLLYLRIFPKTVSRRFSYTSWVLIGALAAYGAAFIMYCGFQCTPVSYVWTQWDGEHEGYCTDFQLVVYFNSGFNMVWTMELFDLIVFFLPIPKLMAIQVKDKRRKAGVVLTFLIGLFVTICSMVRLKYLSEVSKVTNATYDYTNITLWSGIESEVGVICACMPTIIGPILAFFRKNIGSKISSLGKSSTGKSATTSSHVAGDKGVTRLPSDATEPESGLEMDNRQFKNGGIERTTETSIYHHPAYEQSSDDNIELLRWKR